MNSFIGVLMIRSVTNAFKKMVTRLEKGIEFCKKAIEDKNNEIFDKYEEIGALKCDITDLERQIKGAENMKDQIRKIVG